MRILIIEDEPRAGAVLKALLEQDGHEVAHAITGEEALATAAWFLPRLVISDFHLPGAMNGAEAGLQIRFLVPDAQLIMITGYPLEEVIPKVLPVNPLAVFEKPVEYDPLSRLIQKLTLQ